MLWTMRRSLSARQTEVTAALGAMIFLGAALPSVSCAADGDDLVEAAERGRLRQVVKLLERGTDVDYRDENGWTALMHASFSGETEVVRVLLDAGADVNYLVEGDAALGVAAIAASVDTVQVLLDAGANVNVRLAVGSTPLWLASARGPANKRRPDTEVINALIQAGADVNASAEDGRTPLMVASIALSADVVEALIRAGADVNAQTNDGQTALDFASELQSNWAVQTVYGRSITSIVNSLEAAGATVGPAAAN